MTMASRRTAVLALLALSFPQTAWAAADLPPTVLWAWERPCDLAAIDPRSVGVAFLALTLRIDAGGLTCVARRQPLRYPPDTRLVAVVRVETAPQSPPRLNPELAEKAAVITAALARAGEFDAIQVDFDATVSERAFYRDLLAAVRRRLPGGTHLSITALASWCLGDRWLAGLPVDDAVPMLFRMGADADHVRAGLEAGDDFAEPLCRSSVGLADDEPVPTIPRGRRRYLFLAGGCGPGAAARTLQFSEKAR